MYKELSELSIIIPVYNEEKNIHAILDNLSQQSVSGFEVVVIDDGSTDNTASIVKNYSAENFFLVLFSQNNAGAAQARENGIKIASGKYVAVVDCDDGLSENTLENAFSELTAHSANISLFNLVYTKNLVDKPYGEFKYFTSNKIVDGFEAFENCISVWGLHAFGIYEKQLIIKAYSCYHKLNVNNLNYLNNDEIISRICFNLAGKIILSTGKYFFVRNPESTTRRVNKNYYKVINNAFLLRDYIGTLNVNGSKILDCVNTLIISTIWGVTVRYVKWYLKLSSRERMLWKTEIRNATNTMFSLHRGNSLNLAKKSIFQLLLIKYFI